MSWNCPHQMDGECVRLKKICQPLQKGCVLDGKVRFIGSPLEDKDISRIQKGGKRDVKSRSNYGIQRRP